MKKELKVREVSSHRLNFVKMFQEYSVALVLKKEKNGVRTYLKAQTIGAANAWLFGGHLVDGTCRYNYRIFKGCEVTKRGNYIVNLDSEISASDLGRKQIRFWAKCNELEYITCVLRYYEITTIVDVLRRHKETDEFWKWVTCSDRTMQINHISGEYSNSGNIGLLEICTQKENLLHARALRHFRKVCDVSSSVFLASVDDCKKARAYVVSQTGKEKYKTEDMYKYLLEHGKIVFL